MKLPVPLGDNRLGGASGTILVDLNDVVELICLVYHEARNVRHPIKAGKVTDASVYAKLLSLPNKRDDAWQSMKALRDAAVGAGALEAATKAFQRSFGVSLADLVKLYAMPIWKDSNSTGGHKWVGITSAVCELIDAINSGGSRASEVYDEIVAMRHNTGRVADKLQHFRTL